MSLSRWATTIVTRVPYSLASSSASSRTRQRVGVRAMASAAAPTKLHILQYTYVGDILEKRGPFREAHIGAAVKKAEEGKMVMAGALADPVDGALFIFKEGVPVEDIEEFARTDPYVVNKLVTNWVVRPYMVVAGNT